MKKYLFSPSGFVFIASIFIYFATIDSGVAFWDCPEYVTCASRLEIGHPPGNPIWMLAMRVLTIPFSAEYHPLIINLASGMLTALSAMLLTQICFPICMVIAKNRDLPASMGAITGGLIFAYCDSVWFSAVEAEVYAMSLFLSLLSLRLILKWYHTRDKSQQSRLMILIAYIMGLSLGVHQLNLLLIPVMALIVYYRLNPVRGNWIKGTGAFLIGCGIVVLILFGIMNGVLVWAGQLELFAVNRLSLPFFSGVLIYIAFLIFIFSASPGIIAGSSKLAAGIALFFLFSFSGLFVFDSDIIASFFSSAATVLILMYIVKLKRRILLTISWSLGFIILGYCSFALILIRGYAAPPMNEGTPTDIFALASYIARDQYGSVPLLYGATPYSKPLLHEDFDKGTPQYKRYVVEKRKPVFTPLLPDAHTDYRSRLLNAEDSAFNNEAISKGGNKYLLADYTFKRVTSPELNMWFPRITSSNPEMIKSYADWAGMTTDNMTEVEVSAAMDSLGNPVGTLRADGSREKDISYRPTYLQNLRMFLTYQVGYMYFRYLAWNFIGRQNDIPSTGEIEHGNFITGIAPLDNAMLGNLDLMPARAYGKNPGRNVYYGIPFLLGILGIILLMREGRKGRRTACFIFSLFLMTGVAIVVYLNQTPGEPRERDYSFLMSYAAYCIWIAAGATGVMIWMTDLIHRLFQKSNPILLEGIVCGVLTLALTTWFCLVNLDDHIRTHRNEPYNLAYDLLEFSSPSIIFSQGDNFSFPLWYAKETQGIGKGHTVIDMSYLAVPGYVVNLMKQGDLHFTAKASDIAYGAYSFTEIAEDADTVPVPLIEALRTLYSRKEGTPRFRNSRVYIPSSDSRDSVIINLRDFASGGRLIPFRQLMILDILAANLEHPSPRPMRFINRMRTDIYRPLIPAMKRELYSFTYSPAKELPTHDNNIFPTPSNPFYADPVITEHVTHRRGEYTAEAKRVVNETPEKAFRLLSYARNAYPMSVYPPGITTIGDSIFYEGMEHADILYTIGVRYRSGLFISYALDIYRDMLKESTAWKKYYQSLSPGKRHCVSDNTLRHISLIPKLTERIHRSDSVLKEYRMEQSILFPGRVVSR
ncbi:MAG: DUF2723 domain-containing protein [Muribaculaceae bacterium]|nr:DUF2723 domain-containing protein [Muribaculaceae bacterium]